MLYIVIVGWAQTVDLTIVEPLVIVPANTQISWHTGVPVTDANRIANTNTSVSYKDPSSVPVGVSYYMAFYDTSNGCYSPHISVPTIGNTCPLDKADLTTLENDILNKSGSTTISVQWHTKALVTDNTTQVPDATKVDAGIFYAVFYDSTNDCYSPGGAIIAAIESCVCLAPPAVTISEDTVNACSLDSTTFNYTVINGPAILSASSTSGTLSTNTLPNGTSTFTYTSSAADAGTTVTITATISDPDGTGTCLASTDTATVVVTGTPTIPTVANTVQPSCSVPSGSITFTSQTGVQYSIGSGFQNSETFSNLAPSTYTLTVRSIANNNCTANATATVTINPNPDTDCDGVSDTQEAIDTTDKDDPCDLIVANQDTSADLTTWNALDCDNDGVINENDACYGFDDALDSDKDGIADGCDPFEDVLFPAPLVSPYTCTSGNATITIDVSAITGGSGTYTTFTFEHVSTNNIVSGSNPVFTETNYLGGDYTITVIDDEGNSRSNTATILPFDYMEKPTLIVNDAISCTNAGETISISVVGTLTNNTNDPATYSYRLLPATVFGNNNQFSDLPIGTNTFEILNNDTGCLQTLEHEVKNPNTFETLITKSIANCFEEDSTIILEMKDATYTSTFDWSIFSTNNTPNDLSDDGAALHTGTNFVEDPTVEMELSNGSYRVAVTQTNFPNCTNTTFFEIENTASDILLTTTEDLADCTDKNGSILVTPSGGTGPYNIVLTNTTTGSIQMQNTINAYTFTNLSSGIFTVQITDAANCSKLFENEVTLDKRKDITSTASVKDVSCTNGDDGLISLTASGGTGILEYAISPNLNSYGTSKTFDNLTAGEYIIHIRDAAGCAKIITASVSEPKPLTINHVTTPEFCLSASDGSITITPSGGTAPYSTRINSTDSFIGNKLIYNNLAEGSYTITLKDVNGCTTTTNTTITAGVNTNASVTVVQNCTSGILENSITVVLEDRTEKRFVLYGLDSTDPLDFRLQPDFKNISPGKHTLTLAHDNGCIKTLDFEVPFYAPLTISLTEINLNEITAIASGGKGTYAYSFNGKNTSTTNTKYIDETGTYSVTVIDENGCEATAAIFMEFIDIVIPSYFTPDGDGVNDLWLPANMEVYPKIYIKVYDRYGRFVYSFEDNKNGWDGIYEDNTLPTGDYWYVLKPNGLDDGKEFIGHFTLYR